MAIKLQTNALAPSVAALLSIVSEGVAASIILKTEEMREPVEINGKTEWQVSKLRQNQICTFIGADGEPCSLEGPVLESDCVEISAAYKVVVQIKIANELKGAFAAGRVSKAYTSLELVRVVEVWDTPKNCLWRAKDSISSNATKTFDPGTGKIA